MIDAALGNGAAREAAAGRVVVVIPTLDEEQIVADGGSRDATPARAKAAGADVIDAGRGYGRACLKATMAAEDTDIVVFMDGDGADGRLRQSPQRGWACGRLAVAFCRQVAPSHQRHRLRSPNNNLTTWRTCAANSMPCARNTPNCSSNSPKSAALPIASIGFSPPRSKPKSCSGLASPRRRGTNARN
jgi:hypothetical protein